MEIKKKFFTKRKKIVLGIVATPFFIWIILVIMFRPSHDRNWELGQEALPHIIMNGSNVTIDNYRNFDWEKGGVATSRYETRDFDLDKIQTVDVFISHFDDFEGLAHIFLSFGFEGGKNVVVSLETRREVGEKFSPVLGILRQFEIVYVVGSEEDIVGLRTNTRDERVYLYPTIATPNKARELFLKIAEDVNGVYAKPRIYNTLTHNCTNELTRRVEDISEVDFPLTWKSVLPGYFDEVLYNMELVATSTEGFAQVKKEHLIDNTKVDKTSPNFGVELRKF